MGHLKIKSQKKKANYIASNNMLKNFKGFLVLKQINEVGKQHEYREKLLPAFVISYVSDDALKAYVSIKDGKFQTVRHRSWRWFDFFVDDSYYGL